jgi:hypothetical protein
VYLGALAPSRASMKLPRRFTLDNRGSAPNGWTPDSKAIIFESARNGRTEIFRQNLNENLPQTIVQSPENDHRAALSPDGLWLLYVESMPSRPGTPQLPERLMRRPPNGGSPEIVIEEPPGMAWDHRCPLNPESPCVLRQQEGKDFVFYSLDPVRGKGQQLGTIEAAQAGITGWNVAPDGSYLAVVRGEDKYNGRIDMLIFGDDAWHRLAIDARWGNLQSVAWAADGLFCNLLAAGVV